MDKNKMVKRLIKEISCKIKSGRIILNYPELLIQKGKVNLNYYHAELQYDNGLEKKKNDGNIINLGDYLSEIVVEYVCNRRGFSLNDKAKTQHLYAIGSILLMGYQDATVWGTGFPYEPSLLRGLPHRKPFRRLDIRCVRGPYTKRTLERLGYDCPEKYGDPAVLLPLIYKPEYVEKNRDYIVIPHYSTEIDVGNIVDENYVVSMNTTDYFSVVDKICASKKVISSSLHGIILAESYGIPAIFYQDRPERFNYKYADWYASTGRRKFKVEKSLMQAMNTEPMKVPDLRGMQEILLNTFPYDMWG